MNKELLDLILNTCKTENIKILKPHRIEEGGKIGYDADYQICISREYKTEKYFISPHLTDNIIKYITKEEALKYFIDNIIEKSKNSNLQFVSLVLPHRAVELAEMVDVHDVLIRHLIDYLVASDTLIDRWDVLIKLHDIEIKVPANV